MMKWLAWRYADRRLIRQIGQTYLGSTSASASWDDPAEISHRFRTSLMSALLAMEAFFTPSGGLSLSAAMLMD